MNLDLGGPGAGCSSLRVRRLLAGELLGAEAERTSAHLAGCARCAAVQREVEEERALLQRLAPFDQFAAGVAEKLARPARGGPAWLPLSARLAANLRGKLVPLAAAAGLLLVSSAALVRRQATEERVRSKGAGTAQLYLQDARGVRELGPGEKVPAGAALRLVLHAGGRRLAAVVLVEPQETTVLYSGAAPREPLPAFEWTGAGPATLLVTLSDEPVDAARVRSERDLPRGAELLRIPLSR